MRKFEIQVYDIESFSRGELYLRYEVTIGNQRVSGYYDRDRYYDSPTITFLINGVEHTANVSDSLYNYVKNSIEEEV